MNHRGPLICGELLLTFNFRTRLGALTDLEKIPPEFHDENLREKIVHLLENEVEE
jgi:hypothetical protein